MFACYYFTHVAPLHTADPPMTDSTHNPTAAPITDVGEPEDGTRPPHGGLTPAIRLVGLNDEFRGREWSFDTTFKVGRHSKCGLCLDTPTGHSVSRRHATVSHDEVGWWVADQGSTNGTYLNGTRLGGESAGPLRPRDIVQFAKVAVIVECATEPRTRRADDEWVGSDSIDDGGARAVWQARLLQSEMTDPLTGVGSRRAYGSALSFLVLEGVSLLAVEIDSFSQFPNTPSNPVGDRAVVVVARLLRNVLGDGGLLAHPLGDGTSRIIQRLARPSGDGGFRILLPNAERAAAVEIGERLRQAVERWRRADAGDGPEHALTISIGAATSGNVTLTRNTDLEARRLKGELEEEATQALRQAQSSGGNRVCTSNGV
jgi:GGDEF domain-containing protein